MDDAAQSLDVMEKTDVVLVDGDLLRESPFERFSTLRFMSPHAKIIVLHSGGNPRLLAFMLQAGAEAYVYKNSTSEELIGTIRSASSHNDHVIISVSRSDSKQLYEKSGLSVREREILAMVAKGSSNNEISRRLYITVGTVKRHLTNIYSKLQTKSRTEAVNKSLEMGVLSFDQIVSHRD
ncbi:DNA-binding response regulator, NarL/FixJ family, contains REC and HTH domains [Actinopolyspora mzabensis]|uniref:DNA-binding response regulator, NarL/FixJ family, contains REC and HTH domains n=2 Tax=Actinopolyspora mzabensis TaxID=995066 RepID=A0A1G9EPN6_ACTMZ|nr:DNA-binding response regulator, NarL/FixJ family, contains REC and HTH domains [Actinopolyspora mzabensis]